ncbi:MAG: dihydrolipoyl dehydrogenase [Lachnospiraceae bacterium]|nr:dihydrolipoyl dehydrogenase [Lachnospiraceae bacterium]
MKDFQIIYKILQILQRSMDLEEFDKGILSSERLGLSEPKWCRIMAIMINEGYISGAQTWNSMDQDYPRVVLTRPEITLKGLEYLESNSIMKKIANAAKGIIDIAT